MRQHAWQESGTLVTNQVEWIVIIFGLNMVIYQVTVQWILSALTNDHEKLARFAGMAKGVLAGGVAASFGTEAAGLAQLHVVAYNFTVQAVGLVCMTYVCWRCVTPTNYRLEDNVIPPIDEEGRMVKGVKDCRTLNSEVQ